MKKRFTPNTLYVWCQLCVVMLLLFSNAHAQTLPPNFQRVTVTSLLNLPTAFAFLPDGRILVCEKGGRLRVIKNDSLLGPPAISLPVNARGERGLVGVAVDPHFTINQFIYLYYTDSTGPHNRVSRFTMNGDLAGSELALLDMPVSNATIHNGGGLAFGWDGKLYIGVGENAMATSSQNLDSYLGKLLRINPDGTVPAGNPFTGGAERSRIWAYGLRNPFSIAPDLVHKRMFVDDVGDSTYEEINDASVGGRNFGYPYAEGNCTSNCSGLTNPVYFYGYNGDRPAPDGLGCAITGGTFFNGAISNYPGTYNGRYFFIDFCGDWINYINPRHPVRNSFGTNLGSYMTQIKQGKDGNLYYMDILAFSLYKIIYTGPSCKSMIARVSDGNVDETESSNDRMTLNSYPNPFNNVNTITFTLQQQGLTQLVVLNMMGKQVATLVNGNLQAGTHRVIFESQHLPAGVYILKMVNAGHTVTRKVIKE